MKLTPEEIENCVDSLHGSFLDLYKSKITDDDIGLICRYLAKHPVITKLNVRLNRIGAAGAKALANTNSIMSLNLRNNCIGDIGAKALAHNTSITSLNISINNIGDEGAKAFALNTTITTLNISNNQIGDAGVSALAHNTTLRSLNISLNQIGDEGAVALALDLNTTLTSLNISNNFIGIRGAYMFESTLKYNTTLLYLYNNLEKRSVRQTIEQLLNRNKIIYSLMQHTPLILAAYAEKDLYGTLYTKAPLSLRTLSALSVIKIRKQKHDEHQMTCSNSFQTLPDELDALLFELSTLTEKLATTLNIESLPYYGINEYSILTDSEGKRAKI